MDSMSRDRELSMSAAFPALMRKVYVWMTLALVITGFTAYGVASSPGIMMTIATNRFLFFGLIIHMMYKVKKFAHFFRVII